MQKKGTPLDRLIDSGQPIVPLPDVQRTTLGLDVLGRFVCNTWDEATARGTRQFDAVVIGAGMFGGYCAEKIYRFGAANNLKVLVLDAGPFLLPTHLQNLPDVGLGVPDPLYPANDPGIARDLVWGMAGQRPIYRSGLLHWWQVPLLGRVVSFTSRFFIKRPPEGHEA